MWLTKAAGRAQGRRRLGTWTRAAQRQKYTLFFSCSSSKGWKSTRLRGAGGRAQGRRRWGTWGVRAQCLGSRENHTADRGCGQGPGAAPLGDLDAGGAGGATGDASARSAARFFGSLAAAAVVPAQPLLTCLRHCMRPPHLTNTLGR